MRCVVQMTLRDGHIIQEMITRDQPQPRLNNKTARTLRHLVTARARWKNTFI